MSSINTMKPLFILVTSATLTACAVGPDYQPPQLSSAYTAAFVSTAPGTLSGAAPRQEWWRLYESPDLDALVAQAFKANTDLRAAVANLQAAQAVVSEARNARLPTTTLNATANYGKNQQPNFSQEAGLIYGGSAELAYEVDLFGRVSRSIESARANAGAEMYARDAVMVRVAAAVTDAYLTACTSAEAVSVARSSMDLAGESSRIVQAQLKAGAASNLDMDRAQAALARTRAAVAPLESQRQVALFELAALLGNPPSGVPQAAANCQAAPTPQTSIPIGDGASLLKRRPDVAEAERRLAAATARIGVATADLFPHISFGASVAQYDGDDLTRKQGFSYGIGPLLSFSFPNMGVARAQVKQAEARAQASLAQFDGVVLNALKETEQALTLYAGELRRREDLRDAEQQAENAFKRADQSYRAGSIAYLDLIVAQNELVESRLVRVQSDQQLASARLQLFRALGGGWTTDASADQPAPADHTAGI
jgi:NodT family efflux transporter outer membrane factor (OMF) lipoprotein